MKKTANKIFSIILSVLLLFSVMLLTVSKTSSVASVKQLLETNRGTIPWLTFLIMIMFSEIVLTTNKKRKWTNEEIKDIKKQILELDKL